MFAAQFRKATAITRIIINDWRVNSITIRRVVGLHNITTASIVSIGYFFNIVHHDNRKLVFRLNNNNT